MSEKTNTPAWVTELKSAIEGWQKTDSDKRHIIAISVGEDENGDLTVNASIIGNTLHLAAATTATMNDSSDENPVGNILRMAAMEHLMHNAKPIGTLEINLSDIEDNEAEEAETPNTESHE